LTGLERFDHAGFGCHATNPFVGFNAHLETLDWNAGWKKPRGQPDSGRRFGGERRALSMSHRKCGIEDAAMRSFRLLLKVNTYP
jgi:hypothetical protein